MTRSLDEVHDLIDTWKIDPAMETLRPATRLLATMAVGDPGRIDVLLVIADHQSMRGEVDDALATLDGAAGEPGADADLLMATRIAYLIDAGRTDQADPLLRDLRRRAADLPIDGIERVAEALEQRGRLREAMRWFTIALRDLDPSRDLPEPDEEDALIGRWRIREQLELPADHYDSLARETLELRRTRWTDTDWSG